MADKPRKKPTSFDVAALAGVQVRTASELCAFDVAAGGVVIAENAAMDQLAARFQGSNNGGGEA